MEYWHEVDEGSLPRKSRAVQLLLNSVDCALDPGTYADKLRDWEFLESELHVPQWKHTVMGWLDAIIPKRFEALHDLWFELHDWWITAHEETAFYACTAFLLAHERAQIKTCDVFGGEGMDSPEEAKVVEESTAAVANAEAYLASHTHPEIRADQKVKNAARILLEVEHQNIEKLQHNGVLTAKEAEEMMEQVTKDLHKISTDRKTTALRIAHTHTLQRKMTRLQSQVWLKENVQQAHDDHEKRKAHTGHWSRMSFYGKK
jgi:hypothetical protein